MVTIHSNCFNVPSCIVWPRTMLCYIESLTVMNIKILIFFSEKLRFHRTASQSSVRLHRASGRVWYWNSEWSSVSLTVWYWNSEWPSVSRTISVIVRELIPFMVRPRINNIQHFNNQLMHTTLKNVGLLKKIKISKTAPTCFGLQGNHHQGATISTWIKITHLVKSR